MRRAKKILRGLFCMSLACIMAVTPVLANSAESERAADSGMEAEAELRKISGSLKMPEAIAEGDIWIRLYEAESYDKDRKEKPVTAEAEVDENGEFTLVDLKSGAYRLEFFVRDGLYDNAVYELAIAEDETEPEYEFEFGEAEDEYFAAVELELGEEDYELRLELQETDSYIQNLREEEMLTVEALFDFDQEKAGAAETADSLIVPTAGTGRMIAGETWSYDIYYVGEDNLYHVDKTEDFSIKYQMQFHTSEDMEAGDVVIRIPSVLLEDRDGAKIRPADIAVPMGTPSAPVDSRFSSFNYYLDTETDELVFFNYKKISAGSNAAFQVLYKGLKIMDIFDETTWELPPVITVKTITGETTSEAAPLTGTVDSEVNLTSVTKKAYTYSGTNYTPGLYTRNQVNRYIDGELPEEIDKNFDKYVYVVWEVSAIGNATQPWNLRVLDSPSHQNGPGIVVGYKKSDNNSALNTAELPDGDYAGYITGIEGSRLKSIRESFYVVTAYPKDQVTEGDMLQNNVEVVLEPADKLDRDHWKEAEASWSYKNYNWTYEGDTIGIRKYAASAKLKSWLDIYKQASANEEDKGNIRFTSKSITNGYRLMHITEDGEFKGQRIEGANYTMTTVDDTLYAHSSDDANAIVRLTDKDYYFSSVKVTQKDIGYDTWEEQEIDPDAAGNLTILAMFAGSNDWQEVAVVPWDDSGEMSYTFTQEDLDGEPWRIMAVHNTDNFSTTCNIEVGVTIRWNSPEFEQLLKSNPDSITVQNVSGVYGELFQDEDFKQYYHDQSDASYPKYPESLQDETIDLYGMLIMRDSAQTDLTPLSPKAGSYKAVKASNDVMNNRVRLAYTVTAYDGYELYAQEGIRYLTEQGVVSPGRNEVVFYDLLPYGVQFDPSVAMIAGRTTKMDANGKYRSETSYWDESQVRVTVNTDEDVITNYRGTGRTMVCFHISYEGADSAFYNSAMDMWLEGWGISFGAYYEWKDADIVEKVPNISAFMAAEGDDRPLLGGEGEIFYDDGVLPDGLKDIYADFGKDINNDGKTSEQTLLYAHAYTSENIAVSSESTIVKLVRADADQFGVFDQQAVVDGGAGYTYEITLTCLDDVMRDIVFFDRLERAAEDRKEIEPGLGFMDEWWEGTFQGIQTKALELLGIEPVIYYNTRREAALPVNMEPADVLTAENGWYREDEWLARYGDLEKVEAFAIDITYKTDGTKFVLSQMESVSFQVQMKAPETTDAVYAYNNPSYYSDAKSTSTDSFVIGNSVKVKLSGTKRLEIEKQFDGVIPDVVADTSFEFTVYQEYDGVKTKYANREYALYQLNAAGEWKKRAGLFGTDANGMLYLAAGQKAVFEDVASVDTISVEESESPYWVVSDYADSENGEARTITFVNIYRPVLYVQKRIQYEPEGYTGADEFEFELLAEGQLVADTEFWYVDSVRTDGGIPGKDTEKGENWRGKTDSNGRFKIRVGEIIALFPGEVGVSYTLREIAGENSNWFMNDQEVNGTMADLGNSEIVTNYYRWKSLYLTKLITNQSAADCDEEFTFRILDDTGAAVTGNKWTLMDTGTGGVLNENGEFSSVCAGKTIRIDGLEAGRTYTVQETGSGDLYEAVNGGLIEVTMPRYGTDEEAEITNDYIMRPLSISKIVLYDQTDPEEVKTVSEKYFGIIVKINGKLFANAPYDLYEGNEYKVSGKTDENGRFLIQNGQTAVFNDAGKKGDHFTVTEEPDSIYEQLVPAKNGSHEGQLNGSENAVTFINGNTTGNLLIRKEYYGEDEAGAEAVTNFQTNPELRKEMAVTLTLEVAGADGKFDTWPESDQEVTVIDELNGSSDKMKWEKGKSIVLEPWKTISLTGMDDSLSYHLSESSEDQQRLFEWEAGRWVDISQKTLENNQSQTGTIGENPLAVIVNSVKGYDVDGSRIFKAMRFGAEAVPVGAKLVWRLEEYDGDVWNPKGGISYLTFDDAGATCDQVLETAADGRIILTKTEDGYPIVQFIEAKVKLNYYSGMQQGDLRLVEVLEESDPEWGYLSGYVHKDDDGGYGMDISSDDAAGFLNSNLLTYVEIGKEMKTPDGGNFTMILEQVMQTSTDPVTKKEHILVSEPKGGLAYTIHNSETNALIGESMTTAKGEIRLQAGQYARIGIPDQTLWTVREQVVSPYKLVGMTASYEGNTTKLDENLMLIHAKADRDGEEIILNKNHLKDDLYLMDAATGRYVNVMEGDVVLPGRIIYEGEEYIVKSVTGSGMWGLFRSNMDITSLVLPDTVNMIDANAIQYAMNLRRVEIHGKDVEINMYAFNNCYSLEEVVIVNNVSSIGAWAFSYCDELREIKIPDGIEEFAGYGVFAGCTKLERVEIGEGLAVLPTGVFQGCTNMKEIVLPESIREIEVAALQALPGLEQINLPYGVEEIGPVAFAGCINLKKVTIPGTIRVIGDSAFAGCGSLERVEIDRAEGTMDGSPWEAPGGDGVIFWTGTN